MAGTVTLNTKVTEEQKREFSATAEELGMSASTALKVLVLKFNEYGGFPFEVRKRNPNIPEDMRRDMARTEAAVSGLIEDDSYDATDVSQRVLDILGVTREELGR